MYCSVSTVTLGGAGIQAIITGIARVNPLNPRDFNMPKNRNGSTISRNPAKTKDLLFVKIVLKLKVASIIPATAIARGVVVAESSFATPEICEGSCIENKNNTRPMIVAILGGVKKVLTPILPLSPLIFENTRLP